jgi:hypothetical protein
MGQTLRLHRGGFPDTYNLFTRGIQATAAGSSGWPWHGW